MEEKNTVYYDSIEEYQAANELLIDDLEDVSGGAAVYANSAMKCHKCGGKMQPRGVRRYKKGGQVVERIVFCCNQCGACAERS